MVKASLIFCGCAGGFSFSFRSFRFHTVLTVLDLAYANLSVLFDCGSGIVDILDGSVSVDLRENVIVLVSHLHGDHICGLREFLDYAYWSPYSVVSRLKIFGPSRLGELPGLLELYNFLSKSMFWPPQSDRVKLLLYELDFSNEVREVKTDSSSFLRLYYKSVSHGSANVHNLGYIVYLRGLGVSIVYVTDFTRLDDLKTLVDYAVKLARRIYLIVDIGVWSKSSSHISCRLLARELRRIASYLETLDFKVFLTHLPASEIRFLDKILSCFENFNVAYPGLKVEL